MKKLFIIGILIVVGIGILIGLYLYFIPAKSEKVTPKQEDTVTEETKNPEPEVVVNTVCDWVDKSDIIIKVNFAEGIVQENSYEAGFYFNPLYSTMRVARKECEYRTGFSFTELKGKGPADVGVRNFSDNTRRKLLNEPINVTFDSEGVPNIGTLIEVTLVE